MTSPPECTNCGVVDEFELDGYAVGDRLLEGVMFLIDKNGKASVLPEDEGCMQGLDKEHWLKRMEEYAADGVDSGVCTACGNEVWSQAFQTKGEVTNG